MTTKTQQEQVEKAIKVIFNLSKGRSATRYFDSPVLIDIVGSVGAALGSHSFNAYENGELLGGWAVFKDGWNFCGKL